VALCPMRATLRETLGKLVSARPAWSRLRRSALVSALRVPKERVRAWLEALEEVEAYARRLRATLGKVTVILHGSYARGDFNLWSDIDLIVVSEKFEEVRILDRYDIAPQPPPRVEVVPLTPGEAGEVLRKPSWLQALARGAYVVVDDYGLAGLLASLGVRLEPLRRLRERVEELERLAV
jgi:predicted nucleotidyltransferase